MRLSENWKDYELIDASDGERLERWGNIILIRPDPQIIWSTEKKNPLWYSAHARYHRSNKGGGSWEQYKKFPAQWSINYGSLTFNIKPMGFKHTGVFPEQAVNWDFAAEKIKKEFFGILKEKVKEKGKETILDEMDAVGVGEYLPDINDIGDNSENNKENIDDKKKKFDFKKITTIEVNENNNIKEANFEERDFVNELSENGDIEDKIGSEEHINMSDESSGTGNSGLRSEDKLETVKFSHISPSSIRIFKVFDEEEMYKMIFRLERNTEKIIIAVSVAGEQASIPIVIKKSKDNWAGSLAVNYLYSDTGNAYVKYERAFTSPAPGQLVDKVQTAPRVYTYKVNNLKSESTDLFEIGWNDYLLGSLLSADVFYAETKDEIATIFDGGAANAHGTAFRSTNLGKTKRYGFDLSAEQKFEKFTFKEAYSFIETKILKDNSSSFEGKHIADVPRHKLVFSVDYDITSKFTVGADYEYRAAAFIDNTNKYGKDKAKSVFNLRADYKLTNSLNIYAGINNIFGAKYYNSVGLSSGERIYDPAPRRNYYAGFKYKF